MVLSAENPSDGRCAHIRVFPENVHRHVACKSSLLVALGSEERFFRDTELVCHRVQHSIFGELVCAEPLNGLGDHLLDEVRVQAAASQLSVGDDPIQSALQLSYVLVNPLAQVLYDLLGNVKTQELGLGV